MAERYQLGHRERARNRFIRHGADVLENYELFELLLFYSIPVKDTKGIAKELVGAFVGITELLRADSASLTAVKGIGRTTVSMISAMKDVCEIAFSDSASNEKAYVPDYHECGRFLAERYGKRKDHVAVLISFDNSMRILGIDEVYALPYSSGGVKADGFLRPAVKRGASVAIIAFNRPTGPLFPLPSEMQTVKMISASFEDAGVFLAEQYLISGDKYLGTMQHLDLAFAQRTSEVNEFLISKSSLPSENGAPFEAFFGEKCEKAKAALTELIGYARVKDAEKTATKLLTCFGRISRIMESDMDALESAGAERAVSLLLTLSSAVFTRSLTESVKTGTVPTERDIERFAVGLLYAKQHELIYVLCFDKDGKYLGEGKISEGTVNTSEILPRKILDIAYNMGAYSIILAHNHPRGTTAPSKSDLESTERISSILAPLGLPVRAHYIVAGAGIENFI